MEPTTEAAGDEPLAAMNWKPSFIIILPELQPWKGENWSAGSEILRPVMSQLKVNDLKIVKELRKSLLAYVQEYN